MPEFRPESSPAVVVEPPPEVRPGPSPAVVCRAGRTGVVHSGQLDRARCLLTASYYDRMKAVRSLHDSDVAFPAHAPERRIPLVGKQMRIGRWSAARELEPEIDLAEPLVDPGVSRLHAVLVAAPDGTWSLMDSGSANGTFLNGRKIAMGDLVTLHEGDKINLGAWTVITVHRG